MEVTKSKRSRVANLVGIMAISAAVYARFVRPWHLRWGATPEEAGRLLPGDDLIPRPAMSATHAVTIPAPVAQVWPWVVQIGQGRAGFYSYDWLENLFGMDIHNTRRINPDWQNPQVDDLVPFWRGVGIPIVRIVPPHLLVLGGSFAPNQPTGGTWTFMLESPDNQSTRLIVRARAASFAPHSLSLVLYRLILEPAHFIMERGMLLGIKRRVLEEVRCT
jgi:uncharacterized protein YndB with AHSA1/START domain